MTELQALLDEIARTPDCRVAAPQGQPHLRESDVLPADVRAFYERCGGVTLFEHALHGTRIVGPAELVRSNPEIARIEATDDITDTWYIIVRDGSDEAAISVDFSPHRRGRCYDSFWDRHGVVGSCAGVALSFTELLRRLFEARGGYWYWLAENGRSHGDAYDDRGRA